MSTPSERSEPRAFSHEPVMLAEVVDLFEPVPAGLLVDATVGGGGHARGVLDDRDDLDLLGLDRDAEALDAASEALRPFGARVTLAQRPFAELAQALEAVGRTDVSGVLFDLGVSSWQLDRAERGFSYRHDGPLDMRMDRSSGRTAAELVNELDEDELARILRRFGDERFARRIAAAIVAHRPLASTSELADVVVGAIPAPARRRGPHPATRTFQALRIAVNDELAMLPQALDDAIETLQPRGRCAVLSYHSGEDRIVKDRFRQAETGGCVCPPKLPCRCGAVPLVRPVGRRARRPTDAEQARNPRSSAARLRAVERLESDHAVGEGR